MPEYVDRSQRLQGQQLLEAAFVVEPITSPDGSEELAGGVEARLVGRHTDGVDCVLVEILMTGAVAYRLFAGFVDGPDELVVEIGTADEVHKVSRRFPVVSSQDVWNIRDRVFKRPLVPALPDDKGRWVAVLDQYEDMLRQQGLERVEQAWATFSSFGAGAALVWTAVVTVPGFWVSVETGGPTLGASLFWSSVWFVSLFLVPAAAYARSGRLPHPLLMVAGVLECLLYALVWVVAVAAARL